MKPSSDNGIANEIVERFEAEEFEKVPVSQGLCYTCAVHREIRTKHCKYTGECVVEFDHHCEFLNKTIGKGNHKMFVLGLFVSFVTVCTFLLLFWRSIESEIQYEYFSKYVVLVIHNFWGAEVIAITTVGISFVVCWYLGWYLLLAVYCISRGMTIYEALNLHKCRYLLVDDVSSNGEPLKRYKNPFDNGFITNWVEFLTN